VLKRESDRLIEVLLNKKSYRHIAIAISDRYMKRAKFDLNKNKNKNKNKDKDLNINK
jgi:DNA relaxase NicK